MAIIAGDQADRELRLFKIKEREFVGISKQINMEFLGGIGSTMSKYED